MGYIEIGDHCCEERDLVHDGFEDNPEGFGWRTVAVHKKCTNCGAEWRELFNYASMDVDSDTLPPYSEGKYTLFRPMPDEEPNLVAECKVVKKHTQSRFDLKVVDELDTGYEIGQVIEGVNAVNMERA